MRGAPGPRQPGELLWAVGTAAGESSSSRCFSLTLRYAKMRRAAGVGSPSLALGYGANRIGSMEGGGSIMDPEAASAGTAFGTGAAKKSRFSPAYHRLPVKTAPGLAATAVATLLLLLLMPSGTKPIILVMGCCSAGILVTGWLSDSVLSKDDGTPAMRAVSDPIKEGAEGFLKVQYTAIAKIAVFLLAFIVMSYVLRPTGSSELQNTGVRRIGNTTLGLISGACFLVGALCSAAAGYISMWVSAHANIRVASAARRGYGEALVICFRGGAFSAVLDITLCVAGVTLLYVALYTWYVARGVLDDTDVPVLMVGYGFGASFVALFMQLGGGIYTKAADVGADLVGKVETGIPEDDPRNPAVVADLVGDMVGDCVGSSADVFESVAAEMIGAMILGSTLAKEASLPSAVPFIFFPVVVHALDIVVSSVGILFVTAAAHSVTNPMDQLTRGYRVSFALALTGFAIISRWLLYVEDSPSAWLHFFGCGIVGMVTAYVFILSTQYYTDYVYAPVRSIAEASTTGHGTNIITGVAVGMKSTVIPCITVSVAVIAAYHLGRTSGVGEGHSAGIFGTAVATMGMLSSAVYVLSMNNFGPIADNAGGIAEMSQQPEFVRETTDRLDAAGNVTKAITKGYSIGSASLACFLLFGAFMDEFSEFSGRPFRTVDIAVPEVLIGGLLGVMMIFWFTGLAIAAVGKTAGEVVREVRRQLKENPGIMEYKQKPDYRACVSLVTEAALTEMRFPGMLCVAMPVSAGLVFRWVGSMTGRPMLGAEVLAGYLMFGTVSGIMMALFLDNVGGAWDNAKKYVELGNFGGKGSDAHKAAVTGDTVGDPFKDTAGPSLHVVIKLLSTTILVLGPLFISTDLAEVAESSPSIDT
ncbi:vacuolar-type H-translocating inorganic pyrophosphatase [Ectocarpus siliculosus]|uniref:H(+)-exporting diphosphatase n=1 Tax=Ectocarpus siliculosus TaxID=2880 RepID=D7G6Z6_ECTSI|nr:vacuolar-type H-translocating inorganic pyrophosphatase [Ectocarpus siliculosus]|eukprot:CBJ25689.1 vacuolar-type H-translocating inorganic pyrophosphatase [Ectocarpus siliculosus]